MLGAALFSRLAAVSCLFFPGFTKEACVFLLVQSAWGTGFAGRVRVEGIRRASGRLKTQVTTYNTEFGRRQQSKTNKLTNAQTQAKILKGQTTQTSKQTNTGRKEEMKAEGIEQRNKEPHTTTPTFHSRHCSSKLTRQGRLHATQHASNQGLRALVSAPQVKQ